MLLFKGIPAGLVPCEKAGRGTGENHHTKTCQNAEGKFVRTDGVEDNPRGAGPKCGRGPGAQC